MLEGPGSLGSESVGANSAALIGALGHLSPA